MEIRLLTPADLATYDLWVKSHAQGTLWQSLEWKQYQEALGRETRLYGAIESQNLASAALVVIDRTAFGLCTWDIPRGPIGLQVSAVSCQELLKKIVSDAKKDKCLSLYLSPLEKLQANSQKLKASPRHEQPEATRILDLTKTHEEVLGQMHQKGRYNIKVAEKHGVQVERSEDIDAFYALMEKTSARDRFGKHSKKHYEAMLHHLPGSFLMIAVHDKKPVAGLIGVLWNRQGMYYYGASSYEDRALMAPYALQWAAIQYCKASGCHTYDLLGVAPPSAESDHPWSGISDFKAKFGGRLIEYPPEKEIVLKPVSKMLLRMKRGIFK